MRSTIFDSTLNAVREMTEEEQAQYDKDCVDTTQPIV